MKRKYSVRLYIEILSVSFNCNAYCFFAGCFVGGLK